jgi:hypothetical protein
VSDVEQKASDWEKWVEAVRTTHYARADSFRRWNNFIGVAAVVTSTVVSAGILTSVHKNPGFGWTLAGAVLAVIATGLTGIRSYLKLGTLSEQHRKSAANFGEVRRKLEIFLLAHPPDDPASRAELDAIAREIADLERQGPGYPKGIFEKFWT